MTGAAPSAPRRRKWPLILLFLLLLTGGGIGLYFYQKSVELRRWKWAKIAMPQRMARVPASWTASTLADRLQKTHKIRDADTFREAATQVGLKSVGPGGYFLPAIAGPLELAQTFKKGPTHQNVTFPEGFTVAQIATRLQKNGFAGAAQLAKFPAPTLEGRLFPDTYLLPLTASGKALVVPLSDRWRKVMAKLPRPFPKVADKELTPIQLVALASLVEREAGSRAEMPVVAGVIYNRLNHPMRLQVDASVQYARLLDNQPHKARLLFSDLEIDSPYNTYLHDGLPPTPICNPGEAALRAADRPTATTALFYVYSPKLKHHLFAATFEAHKHNIAVVRLERQALEASP